MADIAKTASTGRRIESVFTWTGAVLVILIVLLLNVVGRYVYGRADLSAGHIYSISRGTKLVLGKIKDNLVVKVYFTPRLPQPYGFEESYLRDLLGEYRAYGHGHVKIEYLDPELDPRIKKEAASAGIQPLQINIMGADKFEIKEIMMGVLFLYNGKSAVLPMIHDVNNLEYDLTSRIRRLTRVHKHIAGFITGHGEKLPGEPALAALFQTINEEMDTEVVDLAKPVAPKVDALWALAPVIPFKSAEIERLKAWVGSGKSLGLLVSKRSADLSSFRATPVENGIDVLLRPWGLELRPGYVVDAQCERIQMTTQYGFFQAIRLADYPFIPIATSINTLSPAMRGIDMVAMPFSEPLLWRPSGAASSLTFTSLVDSSKMSWYQTTSSISPSTPIEKLESPEKGPFSLAGVVTGAFYKVTPSTATAIEGMKATPANGRVIVVGSASQVQPGLLGKSSDATFLLNLLEWSFQDETLLSIRAKGVHYRPLRQLSPNTRALVKFLLIIMLPAMLPILGSFVYRHVWLRRAAYQRVYGEGDSTPSPPAPVAAGSAPPSPAP